MRAISAALLLTAIWARAQDDPLRNGILEFHRGQYQAALASLEKAADTPKRRIFLALTRAATGRCEPAERELAAQFEKNTEGDLRRLAGLALAQCRLVQADYDGAFPVLVRLKTLYPADADVLYQFARLHMKAWNDTLLEMFQKTPSSFRVNQISAEVFEIQPLGSTTDLAPHGNGIDQHCVLLYPALQPITVRGLPPNHGRH